MRIIFFLLVLLFNYCQSNEVIKKWIEQLMNFNYDFDDSLVYSNKLFRRSNCENLKQKNIFKIGNNENSKICIEVNEPNIENIKATIKDNYLNGRIVIEYKNSFKSLIYSKENHLFGLRRYFNEDTRLINVTDYLNKTILKINDNGYSIGFKTLFSNEYAIMFSNYKLDSFYDCPNEFSSFNECHLIKNLEVRINENQLSVINAELESNFKLIDGNSCSDNAKETIPNRIRNWIQLSSEDNLLWNNEYEFEPFVPSGHETSIDISLKDYFRLPDREYHQIHIYGNDNKEILVINSTLGDIKSKIPNLVAKKQIWKNPLTFYIDPHNNDLDVNEEKIHHYLIGKLNNGKLEGIVRVFGRLAADQNSYCSKKLLENGLAFVGNFKDGKPKGICWKGLLGGGWIYGKVNEDGKFTGNNIAYIYPDLKTVLLGSFQNGLMISAQETDIVGVSCNKGILNLEFSPSYGPIYKYEPSLTTEIQGDPFQTDPLDSRYIYVASSSIPTSDKGDGIFAKEDIKEGVFILVYSGIVLDYDKMENFEEEQKDLLDNSLDEQTARYEYESSWKYRMSLEHCTRVIDLPKKFYSTKNFRRTLGHKINHSFEPNSVFTAIDSPRFGVVKALKTLKSITKGEEIFVNYNYDITYAPTWYVEEHNRYLSKNKSDNQ